MSNRYGCQLASGNEMELQFHLVPELLMMDGKAVRNM
jgi:hypothetical protein